MIDRPGRRPPASAVDPKLTRQSIELRAAAAGATSKARLFGVLLLFAVSGTVYALVALNDSMPVIVGGVAAGLLCGAMIVFLDRRENAKEALEEVEKRIERQAATSG